MTALRIQSTTIAGMLACGTLIGAPSAATPQSASQSVPQPAVTESSEINIENDKTAHRTRARIENEFIDYKSGDALNSLTYSGSYAVGIRGRKDWQLTLDWPLVHYQAGAA